MKTRQEIERISRQKKRFRLMIVFACVFTVLFAAAIFSIVYFAGIEEPEDPAKEKPEIIEGEDYYRNYAIAYPRVDDANITSIAINNVGEDGEAREYLLLRSDDADGDFLFSYREDGEVKIYHPSILDLEADYEYKDLYAKETEDGYGTMDKLTYLFAALEVPYFGERIPFSTDKAEYAKQMRLYGFSEDDPVQVIKFTYKHQTAGADTTDTADDKFEESEHKITIGDKTLSGTGYYYMVDGRPYVYSSNSNYYDYALMAVYSFINGRLIAAGLSQDSAFEPTLTTNFTYWKNELHKEGVVAEDSKVVILSSTTVPIAPADVKEDPNKYIGSDGYVRGDAEDETVELSDTFSAYVSALVGSSVGSYGAGELEFTLASSSADSKKLTFDILGERVWTYKITAIESILEYENENGTKTDNSLKGTPVGENDLIKVTYTLRDEEGYIYPAPFHAVIDLSNKAFPAEAVSSLRSAKVGELSEPVEFSINYTKDNCFATNIKFKITEIISIFDQDGKDMKKITDESIVAFRYRLIVTTPGKDGEPVITEGEENTEVVNLHTDESAHGESVGNKLMGLGISKNLNIVAYESDNYYEFFNDFVTYGIEEIKYFITSEEVVSFRYLNNSERDPYYGESIYENNTDGYELYGLNSNNCESIVKLLGGIGESNSTSSDGLVGETIDIGITPAKMEKYGLYEYTVYFELPRGIITHDSGEDDVVDDYSYYSKLGTTLYISKEKSDGTRIVASDVFDVIARVDGEKFKFLEHDFVEFWARRNLVLTNVANIENVSLEFSMDDLVGKYDFELTHKTGYLIITDEGKYAQVFTAPENYIDTYDNIYVYVTPSGECTENALTKYLKDTGRKKTSLNVLYNNTVGGGDAVFVENSYDYLGTGCFKDAMRSLYFVEYEGFLSEEEQAKALEEGERVMKFSFKLKGNAYRYTYEFYRFDDRRVLVSLYQEGSDGAVTKPLTNFYVSTFAFKKMAGTFLTLLNGVEVNLDQTYYELPSYKSE